MVKYYYRFLDGQFDVYHHQFCHKYCFYAINSWHQSWKHICIFSVKSILTYAFKGKNQISQTI